MLDVHYRQHELYLGRIEILPSHQDRGIGSHLINTLIEEAARRGQDFVVEVLPVNHRAQALYRGLGMKQVTGQDAVNGKIIMRSARAAP